MSDKVPEIIYHYCSLVTMKSILESKTLRLSDITKSNDITEIKYCLEGAIPEALRFAYPGVTEELINNVMKAIQKDDGEMSWTYYAICFSKESDQLSQWRAYADDGRGVSIGFDNNLLIEGFTAIIENAGLSDKFDARKSDVLYGVQPLMEILKKSILAAKADIERDSKQKPLTNATIDRKSTRLNSSH